MLDEIRAVLRTIEAMPREAWAHMRLEDGRWHFLERGEAPPGWRTMSHQSRLFSIDLHHEVLPGDRIVVSEQIWEADADRVLREARPVSDIMDAETQT